MRVNNTNFKLVSSLARIPSYLGVLVKLALLNLSLLTGVVLTPSVVQDEPLNYGVDCEIWPQKLETSFYRVALKFDVLNRLSVHHPCDRRTDRRT